MRRFQLIITMIGLIFYNFALTSCISNSVAASAPLSPQETQLLVTMNNNLPQQLQLTSDLVKINTSTSNVENINQLNNIIDSKLKPLGFSMRQIFFQASQPRAPHLYEEHLLNSANPKILIIGHTDIAYTPSFQPTFSESGGILYGTGIVDDKSGIAMALTALSVLNQEGILANMNIGLFLTSDEEDLVDNEISRAEMKKITQKYDYVLELEPARSEALAGINSRGDGSWVWLVKATQGHSSRITTPEIGYGAIFEFSRVINEVRNKLDWGNGVTFNVGLVSGGTSTNYNSSTYTATSEGKTNAVPSILEARGDLRYMNIPQRDSCISLIKNIINSGSLPGTNADNAQNFVFTEDKPAFPLLEGNKELLAKYSQVSQDLGGPVVTASDPKIGGGSDISFVADQAKIGGITSMGASGTGAHAGDSEQITLNNLKTSSNRFLLFLYRLTK